MQWSAILGIVLFIVLAGSVDGILAFSFFALVSFAFARNLLDGENKLDFTRYFTSKCFRPIKEEEASSKNASIAFPRGLTTCRHALIRNILRDFVISWYENVAMSGDFILETRSLLEDVTVRFYEKLSRTSVSSHTEKLCILLHRHLLTTQNAKILMSKNHKNFVETYSSLEEKPRSYQNDELEYLRTVVDLLLYRLVPPKTLGCDVGRFILREILAFKLMLPLLDKMSDPDFLNTSIINIFGENNNEKPPSSAGNEASKSHLKVSKSFMEYLDENLKSNPGKSVLKSKSATKYKFRDVTVLEREHSEVLELSMESGLPESNGTSNALIHENSITLNADKMKKSDIKKNTKQTGKERNHLSILNGLAKVKNDIFKSNKEKGQATEHTDVPGAKVHSSGFKLGRQFRKIQSAPLFRLTGSGENLSNEPCCKEETVLGLSGTSTETAKNCSLKLEARSLSLSSAERNREDRNDETVPNDDQTNQYLIGVPSEPDSPSFCFDHLNLNEGHVDFLDSGNVTDNLGSVNQKQPEILSGVQMSKPNQTEANSTKRPGHTISFSNNDEWDSEYFEKYEDDLLFDGVFAETEGVVIQEELAEDDVSRADFAINDHPNASSLISIQSTERVTDHSFEPYKSRYTVYIIVYSAKLWPQLQSVCDKYPEEVVKSETQDSIRRRYREFMELHHRLVCGSLASQMKDIPKPNRKFNSPFFRLDQDVIDGRQTLLENYLKCLVMKPAILNCEDFREFLGVGGNGHSEFKRHINMVPTLPNVPRIDKTLQKKVTKIIDHIKTAFDTGPVEGDKEEEYDDIRRVLGEDGTSQDDVRTFAVCSGACRLNQSCCYSDNIFHAFVQRQLEQEQQQPPLNQDTTDSPPQQTSRPFNKLKTAKTTENGYTGRTEGRKADLTNQCSKLSREKVSTIADIGGVRCDGGADEAATNPLIKTVLNLSCHLLGKRGSWVCLEPVQEAATAVFGCFLEWWLEGLLSELVTEEQWLYYLTLLTDTVWPGGELRKSAVHQKTLEEKSKTKEEAIRCLSKFFGAILHTALGTDALEFSAREIVDSLQYAEINRRILLDVLEVILCEVFPDLVKKKAFYLSSRNC